MRAVMIEAFVSGWQRSFDYEGRSSRSDFWWFVLANVLVSVALLILAAFVGIIQKLFVLYYVASIIPSIPLTVRRLRDAGKHWGWMFISLVPVIGSIWLIVLLVQPSLGMSALPM